MSDRRERVSLQDLTLDDVIPCIIRIRAMAASTTRVECFAQDVMAYCQALFVQRQSGDAEVVLSRCFVTQTYGELSSDVRDYVEGGFREDCVGIQGTYLILMGSAGVVPGWNDPSLSSRYRAVPLGASDFSTRFPMFAECLRPEWIRRTSTTQCDDSLTIDSMGSGLQMFCLSEVEKSAFIPAQKDFVEPYGVKSALGCVGRCGPDRYFFVIMFVRTGVSKEVMELLRLVALAIRVGFTSVVSRSADDARHDQVDRGYLVAVEELLMLYEKTVQATSGTVIAQREQLQGLTERIMTAQEEERSRVARELHDHVTSELGGIGFGMRSLIHCPPGTRDELLDAMSGVVKEIDTVMVAARHLSYSLHPVVLDRLGITTALARLLDDVERRSGLYVERQIDSVFFPFQSMVSTTLYRIAQEALQNVVKHARATFASAKLYVDGKMVVLCIRDGGVGFLVEDVRMGKSGFGLLSMTERVRQIGGQFRIESKVNQGTLIEVRVPYIMSSEEGGIHGPGHTV